jgi:RNA polymerase sigma factor (sigma-70 family)
MKTSDFESLYRSLSEPVFQFLKNRTGDAELASDLLQETFLKVFRFWNKDSSVSSARAWVFQVARNTWIDSWRSSSKEGQRVLSLEENEERLVCNRALPEERLERRSFLKQWLKGLTSEQRQVVWLRLFRGLSDEEISKRLELSVSAVKSLLFRARQQSLQLSH